MKADAIGRSFSIENTQWKEAKDLIPGDVSLSADGSTLEILSVEIDQREETVYNFEVEDFHTYFVGEVGVWVHNESYEASNPLHSSVGKYLKLEGAGEGTGPSIKGKKTGNYGGDIQIQEGEFNSNSKQWESMPLVNGGSHARDDSNGNPKEQPNRIDLAPKDGVVYGPGVEFKVNKVIIGQDDGSLHGNGKPDVFGTKIEISVLNEDGSVRGRVLLAHFNKINEKIYKSAETGEKMKAGTYLGQVNAKVGSSTNPHLHAETLRDPNTNKYADKQELLKWMQGK